MKSAKPAGSQKKMSVLLPRPPHPFGSRSGSALTVILVTVVLIGISLVSYLGLVANQNRSIVRSQQWNAAIPVAEAGIEEALAHINKHGTNRVRDGWEIAPDGTNVFKNRTFGDAKYEVFVNAFRDPPLILVNAHVKMPGQADYMENPRTVLVKTTFDPYFTKALAAKGQIDLAGNNITSDSFDSTDPNYSTGGQYDPAKNKANGDIATNSSLVNSLSVGNANVMGSISTGPGGSISIGANGTVGSKAFHLAGNKGIESGWARDDMNVQFPDVQPPYTMGLPPLLSGSGDRVVDTGDYMEVGSLSLSSSKLIVTGHARLYVRGNVSFSGSASIEIQPGASLQLIVGGSSTFLGGNGVVNMNNSALHFNYWGLNGNTSVTLAGNASLTGTIYAPHANLTMNGSGSTTYDLVGAAVAKTAKLNGHFNFHYDEALKSVGPKRWYLVTEWNETVGWTEI